MDRRGGNKKNRRRRCRQVEDSTSSSSSNSNDYETSGLDNNYVTPYSGMYDVLERTDVSISEDCGYDIVTHSRRSAN